MDNFSLVWAIEVERMASLAIRSVDLVGRVRMANVCWNSLWLSSAVVLTLW